MTVSTWKIEKHYCVFPIEHDIPCRQQRSFAAVAANGDAFTGRTGAWITGILHLHVVRKHRAFSAVALLTEVCHATGRTYVRNQFALCLNDNISKTTMY